ncbi:MAG: cobalamin-binding protein [Magnetococcales bacterium]|nr:cobalamin-binding protein [Magnetococcales bacterium]
MVGLLVLLWSGWTVPSTADPGQSPSVQRIVALAPNLTELLFAVGAGGQLVAVADYSDYPPQARQLPRIGGYDRFDPEAVIAARPDLVIGWPGGNPEHLLASLERFGLRIWLVDPRRLEDIPAALETLGSLTGHEEKGRQQALAFRERLERLRHGSRLTDPRPSLTGEQTGQEGVTRHVPSLNVAQSVHKGVPRHDSSLPQDVGAPVHEKIPVQANKYEPVRVFYQVWHKPLMTINGAHLISDVIRLCGGENIFDELPPLAPVIDPEAVLARNPEAIVASGMDASRPEWLDHWQHWTPLLAVRRGNLFFVPPDLLQRHTPRILDGAELLCDHLEQARQRR